jgi:hypothetical protein
MSPFSRKKVYGGEYTDRVSNIGEDKSPTEAKLMKNMKKK